MTEFGSFDNSTCKRVLDLLEPGDLTLGQVVIKRVAVVERGVNNGSGDGGGYFGIKVWTDTTYLLTSRGVAHLVVHGTTGSTSYETTPPVPLETSGGEACCRPWTWWCRLRDHDDDDDDYTVLSKNPQKSG